jgi:hypothetical protein
VIGYATVLFLHHATTLKIFSDSLNNNKTAKVIKALVTPGSLITRFERKASAIINERQAQKASFLTLETNHTPFGGQFDQFWSPGQGHIGIEIFLPQLASFSAGRSDVDRYLVFHQIG